MSDYLHSPHARHDKRHPRHHHHHHHYHHHHHDHDHPIPNDRPIPSGQASSHTTIAEAMASIAAIAPSMPPQIGELLSMQAGIGQFAANNPDPMHQPEFFRAYQSVFGQHPYTLA